MQLALLNSNLHSRYRAASGDVFSFCMPHQFVFLNLLAVSQHYEIPLPPLLDALGDETPLVFRQRTKTIAEKITAGADVVEAIVQSELLPNTTNMALRLASESGTLDEFYESVLSRSQDREEQQIVDNPFFQMFRLFIYTLFVFLILTYFAVRVVPEFKAMLEEFGIKETGILEVFISVCNTFVNFWFVIPVIFLLTSPFYFPALLGGLKYINPVNWRTPFGDPLNNLRRATAVAAECETDLTSGLKVVVDGQLGSPKFSLLSNAVAGIANHPSPWHALSEKRIVSQREANSLEKVSSGETQAWLLRWKNSVSEKKESSRSVFVLRLFAGVVHLVLAIMVFLTALTVFSTLIQILNKLNQ